MKKVSVFTVLTCFLAGAAHFPCYAGGLFSKEDDNNEGNKTPQVRQSSQPSSQPSRQSSGKSLGGASGSSNDSIRSAQPKPPPSSDLDPVFVAQTPNDFCAGILPPVKEGDVLSAEEVARLLQQQSGMQGVTFSVHTPKTHLVLPVSDSKERGDQSNAGVSQLTLIDDNKVVPSAHPHSSSGIPSMFPAPQELPYGVSKSAIPVSSSSSDRGETYEAGGGILTLPVTMRLFPKPDSAGQLAVIPKVCALSFYNYLSDLDPFEGKMRGKMMLLTPSNKNEVLNLINAYLERHGKRNGQIFAAQKIYEGLKKAIETPSGRKITFRVAPVEGKPEVYFCLEVEGGVIIFGKIPGQEI